MSTLHTPQWDGSVEHFLLANRAVPLKSLWDAFMTFEFFNRYACVAGHAMLKVDVQAFSFSTSITVWTVVYILGWGIIIESADFATVLCKGLIWSAVGIDTRRTYGL